jgi:hypothetical protein
LYVGDQVSLEVISPPEANLKGDKLQVQVEGTEGTNATDLSPVNSPYGIAGRYQATLTWAWDTSGLQPGDYTWISPSSRPASTGMNPSPWDLPQTSRRLSQAKWAYRNRLLHRLLHHRHRRRGRDCPRWRR